MSDLPQCQICRDKSVIFVALSEDLLFRGELHAGIRLFYMGFLFHCTLPFGGTSYSALVSGSPRVGSVFPFFLRLGIFGYSSSWLSRTILRPSLWVFTTCISFRCLNLFSKVFLFTMLLCRAFVGGRDTGCVPVALSHR